jgi:glucose uptake protein GlcU
VVGAVAAVAILAGVYFFGRRKGKKRTTVVEVRRV